MASVFTSPLANNAFQQPTQQPTPAGWQIPMLLPGQAPATPAATTTSAPAPTAPTPTVPTTVPAYVPPTVPNGTPVTFAPTVPTDGTLLKAPSIATDQLMAEGGKGTPFAGAMPILASTAATKDQVAAQQADQQAAAAALQDKTVAVSQYLQQNGVADPTGQIAASIAAGGVNPALFKQTPDLTYHGVANIVDPTGKQITAAVLTDQRGNTHYQALGGYIPKLSGTGTLGGARNATYSWNMMDNLHQAANDVVNVTNLPAHAMLSKFSGLAGRPAETLSQGAIDTLVRRGTPDDTRMFQQVTSGLERNLSIIAGGGYPTAASAGMQKLYAQQFPRGGDSPLVQIAFLARLRQEADTGAADFPMHAGATQDMVAQVQASRAAIDAAIPFTMQDVEALLNRMPNGPKYQTQKQMALTMISKYNKLAAEARVQAQTDRALSSIGIYK